MQFIRIRGNWPENFHKNAFRCRNIHVNLQKLFTTLKCPLVKRGILWYDKHILARVGFNPRKIQSRKEEER